MRQPVMLILRSKFTPQPLPKMGRAKRPAHLEHRGTARERLVFRWRTRIGRGRSNAETARRLPDRWPTVRAHDLQAP
jgi:hypothetical protein